MDKLSITDVYPYLRDECILGRALKILINRTPHELEGTTRKGLYIPESIVINYPLKESNMLAGNEKYTPVIDEKLDMVAYKLKLAEKIPDIALGALQRKKGDMAKEAVIKRKKIKDEV